jgi:U3 small nucleolar ribonucleoprotein protein LCP5
MSHKLQGKSIENHSSIDRLVEVRTAMEKICPIDQKLKYQIDKLISMASGAAGEKEASFPFPCNLLCLLF